MNSENKDIATSNFQIDKGEIFLIFRYLFKLINRFGLESVKKGKNFQYSPELKQEIIDKLLLEVCPQESVSLDYVLPNRGMLPNWLVKYKKNGSTIIEKIRGRPSKMGCKPKKNWKQMTKLESFKKRMNAFVLK